MTDLSLINNVLLIGGSFAAFAVFHSLIAGTVTRDRLAGVLGTRVVLGVYRLAYNMISVLTLIIPLALVVVLPDRVVYRAAPPLSFGLMGIQLIGVVGAAITLLQTDLLDFSGVRQVIGMLRGEDATSNKGAPLQTGGLYGWMRHPLYVFSLLAIWPLPVMTLNWLIFNVAATLYFLLGSLVEERRLERLFGDEYRQYKQRVGWIGHK